MDSSVVIFFEEAYPLGISLNILKSITIGNDTRIGVSGLVQRSINLWLVGPRERESDRERER